MSQINRSERYYKQILLWWDGSSMAARWASEAAFDAAELGDGNFRRGFGELQQEPDRSSAVDLGYGGFQACHAGNFRMAQAVLQISVENPSR